MEFLRVAEDVPQDIIDRLISSVDYVAKDYNFERQTTDIIQIEDGVPRIVKLFIASKKVEQKSDGTLKNYALCLNNFFHTVNKSIQEITANDIRAYLYYYQEAKGVKSNTIEMMRHIFNSFFSWCFAEEYITKDPTRQIKAIKVDVKERDFLEPIELEYIRDACKNAREKAIIDFLFSTGCRVSEMCNVKMKDIDFVNNTVFIENGKGGKSRVTFINAEAEVSLKAYLKERICDSPYLFTRTRALLCDVPLNKKSVEILIRNIVARCPQITKKVTPHVMRHTAATIALRNGMPLEQVKEFLGHSNLNTTMIYAKVSKDDVKRSHEKYLR